MNNIKNIFSAGISIHVLNEINNHIHIKHRLLMKKKKKTIRILLELLGVIGNSIQLKEVSSEKKVAKVNAKIY